MSQKCGAMKVFLFNYLEASNKNCHANVKLTLRLRASQSCSQILCDQWEVNFQIYCMKFFKYLYLCWNNDVHYYFIWVQSHHQSDKCFKLFTPTHDMSIINQTGKFADREMQNINSYSVAKEEVNILFCSGRQLQSTVVHV